MVRPLFLVWQGISGWLACLAGAERWSMYETSCCTDLGNYDSAKGVRAREGNVYNFGANKR